MSNNIITCPATPGEQSGVRMFCGFMKAGDLINVTSIHRYESSLPPDDPKQGYQRPAEKSRITAIGSYLIKGILRHSENGDGLFPSAVTLAAREPLQYDAPGKQLLLRLDRPLQIIDGQHRISGLSYAIKDKGESELEDYLIPYVILETPDRLAEMNQFRIINGTAKSVRTDLVNSILTATAAARGESAISSKDHWKVVVTRVVDKLDKDPDSPWHGLILMPDEAGSPKGSKGKIVRATSFMTSLRPLYEWLKEFQLLNKAHGLKEEADYVYGVVAPYWRAIQEVAPPAFEMPDDYVIQKTPGLFSLHKLLVALLPRMLFGHQDFTKENFVKFIEDSPEITDPEFWHKKAMRASVYGSMKGFDELYKLLLLSVEPKL